MHLIHVPSLCNTLGGSLGLTKRHGNSPKLLFVKTFEYELKSCFRIMNLSWKNSFKQKVASYVDFFLCTVDDTCVFYTLMCTLILYICYYIYKYYRNSLNFLDCKSLISVVSIVTPLLNNNKIKIYGVPTKCFFPSKTKAEWSSYD